MTWDQGWTGIEPRTDSTPRARSTPKSEKGKRTTVIINSCTTSSTSTCSEPDGPAPTSSSDAPDHAVQHQHHQ